MDITATSQEDRRSKVASFVRSVQTKVANCQYLSAPVNVIYGYA